jgi:hypothetical protein
MSMCLSVTSLGTQTPTANRDGYDVRLSLYRPSDNAEELATVHFRFDEVSVPSPAPSVAALLTQWKIHPDFEAVALLFDMNPQVALQGGFYGQVRIRFIRIEPAPELAKAFSDGFFYKIHYDEELRHSLLQSGRAIQKLAAAALSSSVSDETRSCISAAEDDFGQILDHLKDGDQPLNHAMLSQVRGDADILLQFLERMTTPGATAPHADMGTICLLAKDLQLKRERFPDARGSTSGNLLPWPMVRVIVNTRDAVSGNPVRLLTVHCVPVALERSAYHGQEFASLSSPSEQLLPEADYVFWATKGQELVVLGRREVSIRNTGGPVSIDLAVKP